MSYKNQLEKEVIIHIGLPKTASTYLQANVFPLMHDTHRVGRYGEEQSPLYFIYKDFLEMRKKKNFNLKY